ncbi:MAG: hypothetical protein ACRDF4_06765, partial [Rhabdochlamydiaceae bacterium]
FLELTSSGAIDFGKGKNVGLGRLREALGQNKIGKPWSFNMIRGSLAWGFVDPEPDAEDPLTVRNIVKRVSGMPKMQEESQEALTKQKRR